jgi:vacuolar protein-sorting-associated protein 4
VKEKPNVKWEDVAGLETAKKALEEAVVLPQKYPQLFVGKRKPWKTVLLYGPPGTGKTYLAKACANMSNATFFSVSSSDLVSKWLGESEKLVRELFQLAFDNKPAIVFIDEIDALASTRSADENESVRRIKNELLIRLQDVQDKSGVFVLAATNRPYDLDPALRRRFDKRIYIPLPDEHCRKEMIVSNIGKEATDLSKKDVMDLAKKTEGYSAADVSIMVRNAMMEPVRRLMKANYFKDNPDGTISPAQPNDPGARKLTLFELEHPEKLAVPHVDKTDFEKSIAQTKPSVSKKELLEHEQFTKEFGEGEMGHKYTAYEQLQQSKTNVPETKQTKVLPKPTQESSDEEEEEDHRGTKPVPM